MTFPIIQFDSVATAKDWHQLFSSHQAYVQDGEVKVSVWGTGDNRALSLTMLANAQKAGAVCERYVFDLANQEMRGHQALCHLVNSVDYVLTDLLKVLKVMDFSRGTVELFGFKVRRVEEPAIRVFSPFHLDRIKPLTHEPKKWTVRHVLRAVVNGQYDTLRCSGKYTDDYAFDAEVGFQRGRIASPLAFVQKIIEFPSGWKAYGKEDGVVGISCHTFDCNEVHVNLGAANAA